MKKILSCLLLFFGIIALTGCFNKLLINGLEEVTINDTIFLSHNYEGNSEVTWSSSDENVAVVNNGAVTGISFGDVIITLTVDGQTASKKIKVIYPKINITIESKSTLVVGEKYRYFANIPEEYQDLDEGKWSSGNENIITIDKNGVVNPLDSGSTVIIYEYFGNIVSTNVDVIYKQATGVALQGESAVSVNSFLQLNTIFYPNNSRSECVFSSSNDEIATVDDDGLVKGITPGEVIITVTLKDNPSIYTTKKITVFLVPNTIELLIENTTENSINVGEIYKLNIKINGIEYDDDLHKGTISIKIDNCKVLVANEKYLIGFRKGVTNLIVSSVYDSQIFCEITVTINDNQRDEFTEEDYKKVEAILSNMSLKQKVGQMFMVGFSGTSFSNSLKDAIEKYHFGNVIYMGANVTNIKTLPQMSKDIQNCMKLNNTVYGFISTDQEGGRVARLRNGATHFVSNMALAATGNDNYAYLQGEAMGQELLYYGINMDLAPVLDVNNNHDNPVIGVRSYSDDPLTVSRFGEKLIKGLQNNGVIACPKHFPGHGNTNVDSHYGLPVINSDIDSLYNIELAPFIHAMNSGLDCVMTTHIIFNAIDSEYPATLSEKVLTGLLRNELGYKGLIATDGMEMNAVAKYYGDYSETAVLAVKAGVDMLLYTSLTNPSKAYNGIIDAINEGEITEERINESVKRILLTKLKYNILDQNYSIVDDFNSLLQKNNELNIEIACKSLTIAKGEYKPFDKSKNTLIISTLSTGLHNDLKESLINNGFNCFSIYYSGSNDYQNIVSILNDYDQIVFAVSNLSASDKDLINIVKEIDNANKNSIIVALDSPYDYLKYNKESVSTYICLYGNQSVTLTALTKLLCNEYKPTGKLPIDKSLFE